MNKNIENAHERIDVLDKRLTRVESEAQIRFDHKEASPVTRLLSDLKKDVKRLKYIFIGAAGTIIYMLAKVLGLV